MEMRDGTAITIADAITKLCTDLDVNMLHCFYGLGSDGASVMFGSRGGVSKLLRVKVHFLVSNHCIAHRLALACGLVVRQLIKFHSYKSLLDQLNQLLPVRTAGPRLDPRLCLMQAKDVRRLSHEKAVRVIFINAFLPS